MGQFFVYLPFYLVFFLISGGAKMYGQLRLPERGTAVKTQLVWWGATVLVMLGGVFLIALIEYVPFLLGDGPGIDLLLGSTFGGPAASGLVMLLPQFVVFYYLSTWFYRKTGYVYTGSTLVAMLAVWVIAGGSAFF